MPAIPCEPGSEQSCFLARQPIVNRDQVLVAYELLFRNTSSSLSSTQHGRMATAAVISSAMEIGLLNIVGASKAFFNIDQRSIMSDFISVLPADKVVLEVLETVIVTPELLRRMSRLLNAGFSFALDDVVTITDDIRALLPLVSIVKVDLTVVPVHELPALIDEIKQQPGKALLAEKVETHQQFKQCLDLGFHYFQGYYFARPDTLSGKRLQPQQATIVNLLRLLIEEADDADIIRGIKADVSLSLTLLRMANTPIFGLAIRVDSLQQALMLLGRRELQRWLQILLYAGEGRISGGVSPLLALATTRGKLLELVAQKSSPYDSRAADIAFTVGIMSPLDALLGLPMGEVVQRIFVGNDVALALLQRQGWYGDMLALVEHYEHESSTSPSPVQLENFGLSAEDFSLMQKMAYAWSNKAMSATQ